MQKPTLDTIKGVALVNVATCAWATNIIIGRYLSGQIGPLTLTASRYVVASVVFALLLRGKAPEERKPGVDLRLLIAMALTGVVAFAPLLYLGLRFTTAVNGTLMNGLGPLLTGLFAALLIKEPFTTRQIIGSVAALAGVVVLLSGGVAASGGIGVNPGDLLILVAVTMWALYSVAVRKVVKHRSPLSATALSIFLGLPLLIVAAIVESSSNPAQWTPALAGTIIYLGVVPAALGFFSWNAGIKYLGAGGAMVFYNTLPLYGALFGFLFLGETLGPAHLAGGALILSGGLVAATRKKTALS
ncbi:MAG: EamA family transporter [Spirochaetales bacterium]|nr:EamA family transporter [Spirochaetales bacterium]